MPHPPIDVRRIVVLADQLSDEHVGKIAAVAAGWARVERLPQEIPVAELERKLQDVDVLVGWAAPEVLARSSLKVYLCGSAGVDGYFGKGLEGKDGFEFTNAAGTMAVPIAEHVLGLMFALARQIPTIVRNQDRRHWERCWSAGELDGTSICIVGLGSSGSELARRCQALGLRVTGVRRNAAAGHPHAETVHPLSRPQGRRRRRRPRGAARSGGSGHPPNDGRLRFLGHEARRPLLLPPQEGACDR